MTTWNALLLDGFDRVRETLHDVVGPLDTVTLRYRPDHDANPIGWLTWHIARGVDAQLAPLADRPELWSAWADRFGLPYPPDATGWGQTSEEVGQFSVPDSSVLLGYADAAFDAATEIIGSFTSADLDRIVDRAWDPPVTLAVRLVSVLNDATQHAGQVGYVAGLATRAG